MKALKWLRKRFVPGSRRRQWPVRYGVAVMAVLVAFALELVLDPLIDQPSAFLLLSVAVLVAAVLGGFGPGALASLIGAVLGDYFFLEPLRTLALTDTAHYVLAGIFVVQGLAISAIAASLTSVRRRTEEALQDTRKAAEALRASESRYRNTFKNAAIGIAHFGLDGAFLRVNSKLCQMVEDLLFLARSESTVPPFRAEPVDAKTLLASLANRAAALAAEHGATLDATLSDGGRVRADPARVEQAVLVLVDNAAKYGPAGQRITLNPVVSDGELRIEVGDQGPGIPEADLPRIFDRFYRVADVEEPGNGLGLSIALTIAEAHGGRIEAESHPGEGTRISLILPLLSDGSGEAHSGRPKTGCPPARSGSCTSS